MDNSTTPLRQLTSFLGRLYRNSGLRYLLVGGLSFVIDFGLLWVLHELFGLAVWLATGISFLVSFVFNYTLQKLFSFGSPGRYGRTFLKYIALVGFNTLATTVTVAALAPTSIGWEWAKVLATIATTVWNYFIYRYWVFARRSHSTQAPKTNIDLAQFVDDHRPLNESHERE